MCATCGCCDTHHHSHHIHENKKTIIEVEKDVLYENNLLAERKRGYFEAKNILP